MSSESPMIPLRGPLDPPVPVKSPSELAEVYKSWADQCRTSGFPLLAALWADQERSVRGLVRAHGDHPSDSTGQIARM